VSLGRARSVSTGSGDASGPELRGIQPIRIAAFAFDRLHEVLRSTWAVAPLTIPQTNKVKLFGAETRGHVQHA
jgi:hypothetical protein